MAHVVPGRPAAAEFDPYFSRYIDRVVHEDVLESLSSQLAEIVAFVESLDRDSGDFRYAPGKWTVKEVIGHVTDTERIFGTRALHIARGQQNPLPGFDENAYADESEAGSRELFDLAGEFAHTRRSNLLMLEGLPAAAWNRAGVVDGSTLSVRAIPWILAGHADHHLAVLRERYLEER